MFEQKCSLLKVLRVFCEEPLKNHYIKEISRKINLAPTSVRIHINSLEKEQLVSKNKEQKFSGYKANIKNNDFKFYKRITNLVSLKESGLLTNLEGAYDYPIIILFGSYGLGEDIETSDIDIFIITEIKTEHSLKSFEEKLKRKITLHKFNKKEFENLKKKNPMLINNLIKGIVLSGEPEFL